MSQGAELDILALLRYCEIMKNITVSVDDETYRRARVKAAEHDTSVSALVRRFLSELASEESDLERLKREERELRTRIAVFTARDRLPREDVHGRGA
jgi:plasmid stability protein